MLILVYTELVLFIVIYSICIRLTYCKDTYRAQAQDMLCVFLQLPQNPLLILSVSPLVSIVNNVLGDQNYIL